jgi:transportin-1
MNASPQQQNGWHADPKSTKQIVDLLVSTMDPRTRNDVRQNALRQLNGLKRNPGFLRYLSFIFNCSTGGVSLQIRCVAGLYLKTGLKKCQITNDLMAIRSEALARIADPIKPIRKTASSIITCIVKRCQLKTWPQLLPKIVPLLASRNANECFGAFDILSKLCEDIPDQLDSDDVGRPLNTIVPMLIRMTQTHSSDIVRSLSLDCINYLIPNMPAAMDVNFQHLLGAISKVSADKSPEVRRRVCESINLLMEVRLELLMSGMSQIMQFMWRATNDKETEVRLHATSFWSSCCMCSTPVHNLMRNLLPRLLPTLLDGMRFADDDEMLDGFEETDETPDRPEDIEPHLFGKQGKGGLDEDDENNSSSTWTDDQVEGKWNVRKASGLALDNISATYGNEILGLVLPELEKRLNHTDWRTRESAILAVGAVSEGGMSQFLPKLFPFLMNLLKDQMVLIRSIACWALGRYTGWMMDHKKYFEAFLGAILHLIVDPNKRVQEAAVSAFAVIVENAESTLIPYLDQIIRQVSLAFGRYQDKNLHTLYDAIIIMVETLGRDGIRNESHITGLVRPMASKLQHIKNDNRMILPLIECFTVFCREFGLSAPMQSLARPLYHRALKIIEFGLLAGT